jgi:hypothetical protein
MQLWLLEFSPLYCNWHALHLQSSEGGGGVKNGEVYGAWGSLMGKGCAFKKKAGGELSKLCTLKFQRLNWCWCLYIVMYCFMI